MGEILLAELSREPGPLPKEERSKVLNRAVDIHFEALEELVRSLRPDRLLEALFARQEAFVRREEWQRRTLGSRLACFDETSLIQDLVDEVPEATTSALALRFLIEYVAARPPRGLRPFSTGVYDRLVALAAEIANRGMASDVLRFGLEDFDVSVLGSGRLGMTQDGPYRKGSLAFVRASMPVLLRKTADAFGSYWDESQAQRPDFADQLEAACQAEFGLTLTELGELFAELANAAARRSPVVAVEEREVLGQELIDELGWEPSKVDLGLQLLTLGPREDFLKPDPPFERRDVYPWRYGRRLSILARPLILRQSGQKTELVWGMRHVWRCGLHLVELITSNRYAAQSLEMKQVMTLVGQRASHEFNQRIADLFQDAGYRVRRQVSKVGRLRMMRQVDGRQQDIADVDVLAADLEAKQLLAMECKDLEGARTPAELRNEIDETFGQGGKKRSKLEIHLERIAWLETHLQDVLDWMGLPGAPEDWSVQGLIVTDIEVLAPHVLGGCPIPVMSRATLEGWLA